MPLTFREQVLSAARHEGLSGRGWTYDAVLNPEEDADDIDIRPLDEVLAEAKPGDVLDVYCYRKPKAEGWDAPLAGNVEVTLT